MSHAARTVARSPGVRRGIAALATTIVAGAALVASAQAANAAVPASQALVALRQDHVARSAPDPHARRVETVAARRPLTHVRTVLPMLRKVTGTDAKLWMQVRLPGRPNSHKGWIRYAQTTPAVTEWRISVRLSTRRVTVYRDGRVSRRFRAVVGKPSTPTPRGRFFVEEPVALAAKDAGAPFALATSARSRVLQEFDGGPGQIALHGTDHLSGALGTAASHGCIRLSTAAITWLARRIAAGTPLTIS